MVTTVAFQTVFVEVPFPGLQGHSHVKYLVKIGILGPPFQFELSAFGVATRNLHPINQENGEINFLIGLVPV